MAAIQVPLSIESDKKFPKDGLSVSDLLYNPAVVELDDLELPSRDWGKFKIPEFDCSISSIPSPKVLIDRASGPLVHCLLVRGASPHAGIGRASGA